MAAMATEVSSTRLYLGNLPRNGKLVYFDSLPWSSFSVLWSPKIMLVALISLLRGYQVCSTVRHGRFGQAHVGTTREPSSHGAKQATWIGIVATPRAAFESCLAKMGLNPNHSYQAGY